MMTPRELRIRGYYKNFGDCGFIEQRDIEFLLEIIDNKRKEIDLLESERKHWRDECEKTRMRLDLIMSRMLNLKIAYPVTPDERQQIALQVASNENDLLRSEIHRLREKNKSLRHEMHMHAHEAWKERS